MPKLEFVALFLFIIHPDPQSLSYLSVRALTQHVAENIILDMPELRLLPVTAAVLPFQTIARDSCLHFFKMKTKRAASLRRFLT